MDGEACTSLMKLANLDKISVCAAALISSFLLLSLTSLLLIRYNIIEQSIGTVFVIWHKTIINTLTFPLPFSSELVLFLLLIICYCVCSDYSQVGQKE